MDQYLVAAIALLVFFAFGAGYYIGNAERKSRRFWIDNCVLHCSGPLKPEDAIQLREIWREQTAGAELKAGV